MTRVDVLQMVCDLIDENTSNSTLKTLLNRFIQRAYNSLLRKEGKPLSTLLDDSTVLLTYDENVEYIVFFTIWLYYLNDEDIENANIYKSEYMSFNIYAPTSFTKVVDVYGGGSDV